MEAKVSPNFGFLLSIDMAGHPVRLFTPQSCHDFENSAMD
jgi:hypothetical protein